MRFSNEWLYWEISPDGFSGTVPLMNSWYPNYQAVILDNYTSRFKLNVSQVIETLKDLSVIKKGQNENRIIKIEAGDGDEIRISASFLGNRATGTVSCERLRGSEFQIELNIDYLIQALKSFDSDEIIMSIQGSEPVRLEQDKTKCVIIMPLKMESGSVNKYPGV